MPQRSDAKANRARILEVARTTLAEDGDASLNSIAKRAEVGPGTLYRHFPSREALVLAVYRAELEGLVDRAIALLREEPPLTALRHYFERLAGHIRIKRGLGDALSAANHDAITTESYGPVIDTIALILTTGEHDGTIRPGLDPDDVLLMMGCVWRTPAGPAGEAQSQRLLDLVLDSLRPRA
ncbi:TetR/AcrR family transcriptional regulator [Amycolatopsis rhabdoformis]|uniref:TetR/AcrR family transcriptional regulator n=1 Tax=Amycolatopsis rhabdoformis TaxID=1448059 RepID=A0ABZ1IIH0_9PSEU|nr:TetR/AcrR family transcriptional regulator [Amycolatopsis rhabdoformis]WSE34201.1 TetR/AcrR family transcriptional regulator [Amycolatopsis rhabdoformis]